MVAGMGSRTRSAWNDASVGYPVLYPLKCSYRKPLKNNRSQKLSFLLHY